MGPFRQFLPMLLLACVLTSDLNPAHSQSLLGAMGQVRGARQREKAAPAASAEQLPQQYCMWAGSLLLSFSCRCFARNVSS